MIKRHVRLFADRFTTYRDAALDPHDARDYAFGAESQARTPPCALRAACMLRALCMLPAGGRPACPCAPHVPRVPRTSVTCVARTASACRCAFDHSCCRRTRLTSKSACAACAQRASVRCRGACSAERS